MVALVESPFGDLTSMSLAGVWHGVVSGLEEDPREDRANESAACRSFSAS